MARTIRDADESPHPRRDRGCQCSPAPTLSTDRTDASGNAVGIGQGAATAAAGSRDTAEADSGTQGIGSGAQQHLTGALRQALGDALTTADGAQEGGLGTEAAILESVRIGDPQGLAVPAGLQGDAIQAQAEALQAAPTGCVEGSEQGISLGGIGGRFLGPLGIAGQLVCPGTLTVAPELASPQAGGEVAPDACESGTGLIVAQGAGEGHGLALADDGEGAAGGGGGGGHRSRLR